MCFVTENLSGVRFSGYDNNIERTVLHLLSALKEEVTRDNFFDDPVAM